MTSTTPNTSAVPSMLSPADLAASVAMGLRPVGVVRGYYCGHHVHVSKFSGVWTFQHCPHDDPKHKQAWCGYFKDYDQQWINAYNVAWGRLRDEVHKLGAHGVIGCHTSVTDHESEIEAHHYGTAVVLDGAEALPNGRFWITSLAGHRLARLVEAGYVPSGLWYAHTTVAQNWGCMDYYRTGNGSSGHILPHVREQLLYARQSGPKKFLDDKDAWSLYGLRQTISVVGEPGHLTCVSYGDLVRHVRSENPEYPASTLSLA